MGITITARGLELTADDHPLLLRQTAVLALQTGQGLALGSMAGLRTLHRPDYLEDLFLKLTGRQIREDG